LANAKSCTFTVTFTPTAATSYTNMLTVTAGPTLLTATLSLTGTGLAPFSLSLTTLDFGTVTVGHTSAKTVTLTNRSGGPITPAIPAKVDAFATSPGTCANPVADKKSCSFTVTFKPLGKGPDSSTLNVDPGTGAPTLPLALSGTGK
jgi:hypothetical protein